jgi:hypothetical protein
MRSKVIVIVLTLASLVPAHAADVSVQYLVSRQSVRQMSAADVLTFEIHADAACSAAVVSETLTGADLSLVERVTTLHLRGATRQPRSARLHAVLDVPALPTYFLRVAGVGVEAVGGACQFQFASARPDGVPCLTQTGDDVFFEGCNVHVRNGSGDTLTSNGLGNLVVGYNEFGTEERGGSHNVVVGPLHGYPGTSSLVVGLNNYVAGAHNVVFGSGNMLMGQFASITGGTDNIVASDGATVTGGRLNLALADHTTVTGGEMNVASGPLSTVHGGLENDADGFWSVIVGGGENRTSGLGDVIVGGQGNEAMGTGSVVTGGEWNLVMGQSTVVTGGELNEALGFVTAVHGGRRNVALQEASSVLGGECNAADAVMACAALPSGGASTIAGGFQNFVSGDANSVSGGLSNTAAFGVGATVSGGEGNLVDSRASVVSGGHDREALGDHHWRAGDLFEEF